MNAILLLTLPAVTGIVSWLGAWFVYSYFYRFAPFAAQAQMALMVIFIVMIWIGPFTSIASIIIAFRRDIGFKKKLSLYIINAFWIAVSCICLAAGFSRSD
jgi:hypothetical protein